MLKLASFHIQAHLNAFLQILEYFSQIRLGTLARESPSIANCFNTVTLASSNSTLPDDGDHTETCWSIFNVNFNTHLKTILLCITW